MRACAVTALAAFWLVLGFHCLLEALPGFDFLRCAAVEGQPTDDAQPCGTDACQSVEGGQVLFRSELLVLVTPMPSLCHEPGLVADILLPPQASRVVLTAAPPDLPTCWQFSWRTALPARAPSFSS